ncbi:hypothetical protein BLNAU_9149 [Blattamonas nauphoetae]|uniref:Uncharacterized protein n=1 Tax=Blattamonas nauphoetae TaxID=2049346 RepID=A0ABQ9XWF0_9EUKA|nr:hypothetical protein BLNAU_9149 [Blattamonas nauphoetae]
MYSTPPAPGLIRRNVPLPDILRAPSTHESFDSNNQTVVEYFCRQETIDNLLMLVLNAHNSNSPFDKFEIPFRVSRLFTAEQPDFRDAIQTHGLPQVFKAITSSVPIPADTAHHISLILKEFFATNTKNHIDEMTENGTMKSILNRINIHPFAHLVIDIISLLATHLSKDELVEWVNRSELVPILFDVLENSTDRRVSSSFVTINSSLITTFATHPIFLFDGDGKSQPIYSPETLNILIGHIIRQQNTDPNQRAKTLACLDVLDEMVKCSQEKDRRLAEEGFDMRTGQSKESSSRPDWMEQSILPHLKSFISLLQNPKGCGKDDREGQYLVVLLSALKLFMSLLDSTFDFETHLCSSVFIERLVALLFCPSRSSVLHSQLVFLLTSILSLPNPSIAADTEEPLIPSLKFSLLIETDFIDQIISQSNEIKLQSATVKEERDTEDKEIRIIREEYNTQTDLSDLLHDEPTLSDALPSPKPRPTLTELQDRMKAIRASRMRLKQAVKERDEKNEKRRLKEQSGLLANLIELSSIISSSVSDVQSLFNLQTTTTLNATTSSSFPPTVSFTQILENGVLGKQEWTDWMENVVKVSKENEASGTYGFVPQSEQSENFASFGGFGEGEGEQNENFDFSTLIDCFAMVHDRETEEKIMEELNEVNLRDKGGMESQSELNEEF